MVTISADPGRDSWASGGQKWKPSRCIPQNPKRAQLLTEPGISATGSEGWSETNEDWMKAIWEQGDPSDPLNPRHTVKHSFPLIHSLWEYFLLDFLNIFIIISLKSLLNPISGPFGGQFLLTFCCCPFTTGHVFLFSCMCRHFRLFNVHGGWYIVEALDFVIYLTSSICFRLNFVAASLWEASGSLPVHMCTPALSQGLTGGLPPRLLPPTHTALPSPVPWPVACTCFRSPELRSLPLQHSRASLLC